MQRECCESALRHKSKERILGANLRNRRRRSGRAVFAVLVLDRGAHLLERFALVHHLHHVTRDAYADPSSKAHAIKDRILGC
jgi:hypothetical protein